MTITQLDLKNWPVKEECAKFEAGDVISWADRILVVASPQEVLDNWCRPWIPGNVHEPNRFWCYDPKIGYSDLGTLPADDPTLHIRLVRKCLFKDHL